MLAHEPFHSSASHWWEVVWDGHCGPQQPSLVTFGQDGHCLPVQVPPAPVLEMGARGSGEDEASGPPGVCRPGAVGALCGPFHGCLGKDSQVPLGSGWAGLLPDILGSAGGRGQPYLPGTGPLLEATPLNKTHLKSHSYNNC